MASKRKTADSSGKEPEARTGRKQILGIVLIGLTVMLLFSLFSYNPWDNATLQYPPNQPTRNIIGLVGAWISWKAFVLLGLAAYVLPVMTGAQGVLCMYGEEIRPGMKVGHKLGWMALLMFSLACGIELMHAPMEALAARLGIPFPGGAVGDLLGAKILIPLLGEIGTAILLGVVVLIGAVCLFDFQVSALFRDPKGALSPIWSRIRRWLVPPDADGELEEDEAEPPARPRSRRKRKKESESVPEPEFRPASAPEPRPRPAAEVQPLLPEPEHEDDDEPEPPPVPEPEPPKP